MHAINVFAWRSVIVSSRGLEIAVPLVPPSGLAVSEGMDHILSREHSELPVENRCPGRDLILLPSSRRAHPRVFEIV